MNNKIYQLKNFDEVLVEFEVVERKGRFGADFELNILNVNEELRHVFPLSFDENNVLDWIKGRSVPKNRAFVEEILRSVGDYNHPMKTIDISFGLSLNDSYWITPKGFEGSFDDYNLYKNQFSEALKLVAFTGHSQPVKGIATSPELTTNGMLRKCWHREEGNIYLYKGGTFGFANTGLEPYSEYYAYQIGKAMDVNLISYDLKKFKGELVSSCELFTNEDLGYVPMWHVVNYRNLEEVERVYGRQEFADMIVFDSVICNTDRHFGNFGMLRENRTGKVMIPSPLFDHGLSLFCYAMKDDFDKNIVHYAESLINAFDRKHVDMAKAVMTSRQRKMLRKLIGFKFERHPLHNLPDWRLEAIEKFIQYRVKQLLE